MSDKVLDAQIYRNAVKHHRNQIRFLFHLMREGNCHKPTMMKLAQNHAAEIKEILSQWELAYPIKRA